MCRSRNATGWSRKGIIRSITSRWDTEVPPGRAMIIVKSAMKAETIPS
jgi:hypothetical protein